MNIFEEINGDLDKLDEIEFRGHRGDAALGALANTSTIHYFYPPSRDSTIVRFIYLDHNGEPEIVTYKRSDLSDALKVLGAINTYYNRDITDTLTEDQLESYREITGNDRIILSDVYSESSIGLADIEYIFDGLYAVKLDV